MSKYAMGARYPRVYAMLKSYGFGPRTALEIMFGVKRGLTYEREMLRIVRQAARSSNEFPFPLPL